MKLVSRISFSKTTTVVAVMLVLGSAGFQFSQGIETYAQETNSIEFPIESITKILNSVDRANAALTDGNDELVSQNLQEIETEIRDQLGEINIPLNSTSPDEIDDVLVQDNE
ncbi:MAG: hypothetical protein ACPKPY_01805 [Nitrososphaeraceae archaeon]